MSSAIVRPDHHPSEVFVFGSNLLGMHVGGAAQYAKDRCGAIDGVALGPSVVSRTFDSGMGEFQEDCVSAWAIPTCYAPGVPFNTVGEIESYVECFLHYVDRYPEHQYYVTAIGCGVAGFTPKQIAPLFIEVFRNKAVNVTLPSEFISILVQLVPDE